MIKNDLLELYPDAPYNVEIVWSGYWVNYEESGHFIIIRSHTNQLLIQEHSFSVYNSSENPIWDPYVVSEQYALEYLIDRENENFEID